MKEVSMGNPADECIEQRVIDGRRVSVYGLYTQGEGLEEPGEDGYDVWLYDDAGGTPYETAQLLNAGEALYEIPSDELIRELIAELESQAQGS
jgi:hypothetical protein